MKKFTTKELVLLAMLAGIEILLAFTPIGYLKIGIVSISLLMLPVAIAALSEVNITGACILALIFGATSFAQCFGMDAFGTFLCSLNPVYTFIMCVAARVVAGLITGAVAKAVKPLGVKGYAITGLCAALSNTVLFMGTLLAFFWNNPEFLAKMNEWGIPTESLAVFFGAFVGFNCIFEAIAITMLTSAVGYGLKRAKLLSYQTA